MDRDAAISRLRQLEPRLRAAGLDALYLFGSLARGEQQPDSDVDLAFEVDDEMNSRFSLIDQARLQIDISAYLGRPVDFVERGALYPPARSAAEADMVRIF